jgi:integrase/recombinase XerD
METVILKPLQHRGQESIAIYFQKNAVIQSLIQKQIGARWSQTNGCWYIPLSKENYKLLVTILTGKADLKNEELKKYLVEKKKVSELSTIQNRPRPVTEEKNNP